MSYAFDSITHQPPKNKNYTKGFVKVTYCPTCNVIAHENDRHSTIPCPTCRSSVYGNLAGRWISENSGMFSRWQDGGWKLTAASITCLEQIIKNEEPELYIDRGVTFGNFDRSSSIEFDGDRFDLDFTEILK